MWTYETGSGLHSTTLGENKQATDHGPKLINQFGRSLKLLGLFLEYGKEILGGLAAIDLGGQRVIAKIFSGLVEVLG